MAKSKGPDSQSVGNTDDGKRGRGLGGRKTDSRINSEVSMKDVKAGKIAKAKP